MSDKHVLDTGKRIVTVEVQELRTEIRLTTTYSAIGDFGDKSAIDRLYMAILEKYQHSGHDLVFINQDWVRIYRRGSDGAWHVIQSPRSFLFPEGDVV